MKYLNLDKPFELECGDFLPELTIAYQTYGTLSANQDNVVWVFHALTANSDPADWWSGVIGSNQVFDPKRHFIVCANIIGSCYGTTGPASINPQNGQIYGLDFPLITIRDMVKAHRLLQQHLGIKKIFMAMGGSMGGQQVLEWAIADPELFIHLCVLATNAAHSPWGIAFNEAQRMALHADQSLREKSPEGGQTGLEAARAIAMLSYRNYQTFSTTQARQTSEEIRDFRAGSYLRYQGLKLRRRFNAQAYYLLTQAMDSHDVGRNRGGMENALKKIQAKTMIIGIESDILFPTTEQRFLARHIPDAYLAIINSPYGHDGFLIEYEKITKAIQTFLSEKKYYLKWTSEREVNNYKFKLDRNSKAIPGSEPF